MHAASLLLIASALASSPGGPAPEHKGIERDLRVAVPRLDVSATVDGSLSEAVWQQAPRLTSFSEYAPDDGRTAPERTEVLVWYSPTAIYFGIRAYASAGSVRATLAARDHIDNDDSVQILLSTFNDGRQAILFGVNPLGVQMDGAVVESGTQQSGHFGGIAGGRPAPDLSPDYVFDSKGHLTDFGYEVEIRIPFKSLRYQSAPSQDWGLHVIRTVPSTGHEDSWVPARRSAASFLAQGGTLTGLKDLHRGLVMDLNPVLTARSDGAPSGAGWSYDTRRPDVGGNVRWGVTPNLTLNATVNPDFSQVEADATQFQVDPRQAVYFAEKRPFFLDGIEFFSSPNNLIYSRRIVAPVAAAKLTGKLAGTTIAAATAVDDVTQSIDGRSHPLFTIARVQRDVGAASRAAFLYTSRHEPGTDNEVAGADAHLVWRKIYAADVQAAFSRTSTRGDTSVGALWQAAVARSGRRFTFRYSLKGNAPDFRDAAGFIGRGGVIDGGIIHQVAFYGRPGSLVERWTGDLQLLGTWRYDDFTAGRGPLERKAHTSVNFFLRGGWHAGTSVLVERFDYDPSLYASYALLDAGSVRPFAGTPHLPNLDYVVTLDTPRVHGVSANVFYIWGKDENFFEWANGNIVYGTLSVRWRPTERLRVDLDHNLQTFERRTDHSYVAINRVPRLRLEYQATRAIFFRYVGEYAGNYQDGLRDDSRTGLPIVVVAPDGSYAPAGPVRQRAFRNDFLFSYQPTPGTVIFAGYGNRLGTADAALQPRVRRTGDGIFLKVSYLFRM